MTDEMKKCPYCAEMIRAEASKCRYCGSMLDKPPQEDPHQGHWRRVNAGKMIGGVCTGLAREFNAPQAVLPLRIFFIISTFFYSFGLILYIILWILMPPPTDQPATAAPSSRDAAEPSAANGEAATASVEAPQRRKSPGSSDTLLGLFLILAGVMFMLLTFTRGRLFLFPLRDMFGYPELMFHNLGWFPGLWFGLVLAGLLVILLGALKVFRVALGCGLIVVGGILLVVFVPFIPAVLFFPVMLIAGVLLLLIGIIKMIV